MQELAMSRGQMRVRWAVVVILLVAACGSPAGLPAAQTSASSTRIGSPPPVSPEPTNSLSLLPLTTVDFSCVLPVYGNRGMTTGAFISFPAGTLSPATESGYYYDRAISRWVPVSREAVSPDGRRYAYTDGWTLNPPTAPRLHVVDAATRKDLRVAMMPDAQPYHVVDFTSTGIYLVISFEGTAPGVWRFNPATGVVAKVSDGYYQPAGAGLISVIDPSDPNPATSAMTGQPQPNRIDRRDGAGQTVTWFYKPGYAVFGVAFAGSTSLLVEADRQDLTPTMYTTEFWLVTAPGRQVKLAGYSGNGQVPPTYSDLSNGIRSAIADEHGIWIGGGSSLYLVKPTGHVLRVYGETVYPGNGCF